METLIGIACLLGFMALFIGVHEFFGPPRKKKKHIGYHNYFGPSHTEAEIEAWNRHQDKIIEMHHNGGPSAS